jgi:CheY-like chemotaxis protein
MADLVVVDDTVEITELLDALLRGEGHQVRTAGDGAEGMKVLAERLPDLVIMDVEMPVLDGPGMAYRMLVEDCGRESVPIVMVSGAANLPRIARRVGTRYLLAKPFEPEALLAVVARALAERSPPTPGA